MRIQVSQGSSDECRTAPSGRRPQTKPDDLGCESACTGCQSLHPPSPYTVYISIIITGHTAEVCLSGLSEPAEKDARIGAVYRRHHLHRRCTHTGVLNSRHFICSAAAALCWREAGYPPSASVSAVFVILYIHRVSKKLCIFVSVRTSSNFHRL